MIQAPDCGEETAENYITGRDLEMTKRPFEEIMRAAGKAAGKVRRGIAPALSTTTIAVSLDPVELGALEVWIADQAAAARGGLDQEVISRSVLRVADVARLRGHAP